MTDPAPTSSAPRLSRFFVASPETLAAFRIAAGFAILLSTELHAGPRFATLAPALWSPPEGLGWFVRFVPITPAVARASEALAVFGAAGTILGLYTRFTSAALLASTFYLLALGQLGGTVVHDMHLVWFAAILASSPCADALSVDAWWARREGTPMELRDPTLYGIPVWTARALLACVYFFPGLHKVMTQGIGWASADNLATQLHWKWFEWGQVPAFRLDRHPALLTAGGLGVLAFELGFPLLLLTRRSRTCAAAGGLIFHLATETIFRIPFSSLWLCYPLLLDWSRGTAPRSRAARAMRTKADGVLGLGVGLVLLAGALVQGFRGQMRAFPFACYPTFQYRPAREVPDLRLVAIGPDESRRNVPHARDASGARPQTSWGRIWALAGVTEPTDRARLLAYVKELDRHPANAFDGASRVEAHRAYYDVAPEAFGAPPVRDELLATFERDAPAATWR